MRGERGGHPPKEPLWRTHSLPSGPRVHAAVRTLAAHPTTPDASQETPHTKQPESTMAKPGILMCLKLTTWLLFMFSEHEKGLNCQPQLIAVFMLILATHSSAARPETPQNMPGRRVERKFCPLLLILSQLRKKPAFSSDHFFINAVAKAVAPAHVEVFLIF